MTKTGSFFTVGQNRKKTGAAGAVRAAGARKRAERA